MYRARNTSNQRACLYIHNKEGCEYIIFDTETTGLKPEFDYIIELAAEKYRIIDGKAAIIDSIDLFIRPPYLMDKNVIEIHGISNEFLSDKPSGSQVFHKIVDFFGQNPLVIGYNTEFDVAMLKAMYERNGKAFCPYAALDVLEMTRDIIYGKEIESYHLEDIVKKLGIDKGITFHRAIDDVKATYRLLQFCDQEYREIPLVKKTDREHLYINRIYFWKGYNKKQSGVYVETNVGRIYFSTYQKAWFSTAVDLSHTDIDQLEKEVLWKTGIPGISELGRMTEKKFQSIKEKKKLEGVYL